MEKFKTFYRSLNLTRVYQEKHLVFKDSITIELSKLIEAHHVQSFCMIGAGNLEDFHIKKIFSILDRILLTDIDKASVDNALLKQVVEHPNLLVKEVEYTGLSQTKLIDSFEKELTQKESTKDVEEFINQSIEKLNKTSFLAYEKKQFDLVYVSPIYTQLLFYPLAMMVDEMIRNGYPKVLGEHAKSSLLQGMVSILSHFNQIVLSLVKDDGLVFVLSDVFELSHSDEMFQTIDQSINDLDKMEQIYQQYRKRHGMGLGDYGLYDISLKTKALSSKWVIWPKNKTESYIVKRLVLSN